MRARARGVLLLVLWTCSARANHTRRSRAKAQEILIQNIKEKLVTENDDYVPNDESELNLVVNEAKFEINERERGTEPAKPETTTQPEPTQSAPETTSAHPDTNDHELDETQFEIAFGSNIPRPEIKIVRKAHKVYQEPRKAHEVYQEPKIAKSEFEFDHLEPNTAPPETESHNGQINPVFAQLEPRFARPEFAPDLDIDQLEPSTPPPEPKTARPDPDVARPQFKFAPEPNIAQPEYEEFEFTPQSKYIKRKNSGLESIKLSEPDTAEREVENVSNLRISQVEDRSTTVHKSAMLEMVEDISEKTELQRGHAGDRAFKPALRTNQIPNNAQSPFHTNQIPNKRFIIQTSRFVSSTDGALNPSATEESSGASFGHATAEPSAARPPTTETAVPPVVVPAIVVYNFYPIPTGKPNKQVKNMDARGTSRGDAKSKRQRQSGRKAPRKRPRADRSGKTPGRPEADRSGTTPEHPRRSGATPRHPEADRSDAGDRGRISSERSRAGDSGGSGTDRPRVGDRGGTAPESSSAGVITFKYRAEIPLEVPLSQTWIQNAFS